MALHKNFPTDPHVIFDPAIRWYPGEEQFGGQRLCHAFATAGVQDSPGCEGLAVSWLYRSRRTTKVVEVKV